MNRKKVEEETLLTDEEIHGIKRLEYNADMDETELFMVALRGVAKAQIHKVLNGPRVHIEAEDQSLPKYPVVGHPPNPATLSLIIGIWRECGGRMQRENWMKVEKK